MRQKKNKEKIEIVEIPNDLKNSYELQAALINLKSNLDRVIKLINYHFN